MAESELLWWTQMPGGPDVHRHIALIRPPARGPGLEAAERNESRVLNVPPGRVQQGNPSTVSVGNIHTVYISS